MKEYVGGCHCGEVKFKFNSDQALKFGNVIALYAKYMVTNISLSSMMILK